MNRKVCDFGVTQAKQFIDTHIELAKFIAKDNNFKHQSTRAISEITPNYYSHPYKPTVFLENGITTISDVQLNIETFKWESSKNKFKKRSSAHETILQQAYTIYLG